VAHPQGGEERKGAGACNSVCMGGRRGWCGRGIVGAPLGSPDYRQVIYLRRLYMYM
jgi:hypothetical protein